MNSQSTYDPFGHKAPDPVELVQPDPALVDTEKSVFVVVDTNPSNGITPLDADHVAIAIAGILQLYEKPADDLHDYTQYLAEVEAFLSSRVSSANPTTSTPPSAALPQVHAPAQGPVRHDPLAGL